GHNVGYGGMGGRGIEESEARFLGSAYSAGDGQLRWNVESGGSSRRAGLRGNRSASAFHNPRSTSAQNEGGAGGNIDGIGAATASSGGVHDALARDGERPRGIEKSLGCASEVSEGLPAGADGGQQGGDVDIVVVTVAERAKYLVGFFHRRRG